MHNARVIAVIPARGGSKRIPLKNIKPFLGVPLLARTIGRLQQSALFDRIVVSTDSAEIARVATRAGAEAPFRRDVGLADDHASTVSVIRDTITRLALEGDQPAIVVAVYPAAVFVTADDLRSALALLTQDVDYVVPVTSFPYPIQRALRWCDDGSTALFQPEHYESRSQDLEQAYHDVGQFYVGSRDAWLNERDFFTQRTRLLRIPRTRAQDIDTLEDWEHAEQLYRLAEGDSLTASPSATSSCL